MAAASKFLTEAFVGHARLTTGVAATDGSSAPTGPTWYNGAGPTTDWMLVKIIVAATNNAGTANIADSLLHIWADDGTNPRLLRTFDLGDPVAGSTIVSAGVWEFAFGPEFQFPANVDPEASVSVTPAAGNIDVLFFCQAA